MLGGILWLLLYSVVALIGLFLTVKYGKTIGKNDDNQK